MRYRTPWGRICQAAVYSLKGLRTALRQEQAFEYELVVLLLIGAVSLSAALPWTEVLTLAGCWLAVMAFELVNSAVERAFDLIDRNRRKEIGEGKDMLSAAVFLMVSFNVALWVFTALRHRPF